MRVHREHGWCPGDTDWASRYAELPLIDNGARVDLDVIIDVPHGGSKLQRHAVAARAELASYVELTVVAVAHFA